MSRIVQTKRTMIRLAYRASTGRNGKTRFAMVEERVNQRRKMGRIKTAMSSRHGSAEIPDARKIAAHRRGYDA